jgi:hypothetical protein
VPHTRSAQKIQATQLDLEPHSIIPKNNLVTEVKQQIQSKKDLFFFQPRFCNIIHLKEEHHNNNKKCDTTKSAKMEIVDRRIAPERKKRHGEA